MNIYLDVDGCCLNDSLPGGQLVLQKVLSDLLTRDGLTVVLLDYEATTGVFRVLDADEVAKGAAGCNVNGEPRWKEAIGVDKFGAGDLFVDLGAAFGNGWKRSELYPRLKGAGVKIASYVHDFAPYSNPSAFDSRLVVSFLYYIGAFLQYADLIIAPTQKIIDEIDGLTKELGFGAVPKYAAADDGIAGIILAGMKRSPFWRLAGLFRKGGEDPTNWQDGDSATDSLFPDYNLGSPVKLFLPSHDGIVFELTDYVWTVGNTVNIRIKVRGAFRRGLCLKMDFDTFNGRQVATLFANEKPIGEIDACGKVTRTIPIPAYCLGEDRKLTIRMELPNAIAPCEVFPTNGDTRRLALRLFEIRLFDEDPYFACRGGEPLYFAENDGAFAAQYCLAGVCRPEKGFTWTYGEIVTMRFCPFDFNGAPKSITLHYKTFLPEERVGVVVNDVEIANYVARGEEKKEIPLPANCVSPDGFVMVSLRLPDAISPFEFNKTPDHRRLALKLFSVQLD